MQHLLSSSYPNSGIHYLWRLHWNNKQRRDSISESASQYAFQDGLHQQRFHLHLTSCESGVYANLSDRVPCLHLQDLQTPTYSIVNLRLEVVGMDNNCLFLLQWPYLCDQHIQADVLYVYCFAALACHILYVASLILAQICIKDQGWTEWTVDAQIEAC